MLRVFLFFKNVLALNYAVKCFSKSLILIPILKIENYSELLMGVILRKSLVDNDKKKTKTFMASKHNFKTHFGIKWGIFIRIVFFCSSIC